MNGLDLNLAVPKVSLQKDDSSETFDVVVIGGGPAGSTAALYAARAQLKTLVLDKGVTAGALGKTARISNYPGVQGPVDGTVLVGDIRHQAEDFGARFVTDKAIGLDLSTEPRLVFGGTGIYQARAIILASGSMGRTRLVPGEQELLGHGVSYCATCDAAFFKDKTVAVVGNNDEALEEALYLTRFVRQIELIVSTDTLLAQPELIEKVTACAGIRIHFRTRVRKIAGEASVRALKIQHAGKEESELEVQGVFMYLQGAKPISDYVQGQLDLPAGGCVPVDTERQTQVAGVFAVGDLVCDQIKQVVVAAADGAVAAIAAEKYLRERSQIKLDWQKIEP